MGKVKRQIHRIVSMVLIAAFLLVSLVCGKTEPVMAASFNSGQYQSGGSITLTEDSTFNGTCQLNGELDIDLNGHTLTMGNGAYFMTNSKNAVLNIRDSSEEKNGRIYASSGNSFVWMYQGGTFNLYGGTIDGSKMTSYPQMGGCVQLYRSNMESSTFNMYGGRITGFSSTQYGGAVYVASAFSGKKPVFTMYGGTIDNCYSPAGAAVYVDDSGDGPGYFYIKGGKSPDGEPKAKIDCVTYRDSAGNEKKVPNAIYNYGYLGMEGIVDIDGIVYLHQNNWASTTTHFIKVTGRLVVVGDGYIDIDSAYPNSNAVCTGHTVVENVTQTVEGSSDEDKISQEEFYTYGSYFINSTKGLLVSAGYDPSKNNLASTGAPSNWPSYQGDKYDRTYTYVDVKGQTMIIQSSDSPGDKRQMQNYNYLIYTDRNDPSEDYAEYYSIKISKASLEGDLALNDARFVLYKLVTDENGNESREQIGVSGSTGNVSDGVDTGQTYIYTSDSRNSKEMIDDGDYVLCENQAPEGYVNRGDIARIHISHTKNEDNGITVSVVVVSANDKVLSSTEQIVNTSYKDSAKLVNREIVMYIKNSTEVIEENKDYKIRLFKYGDTEYTIPLGGAVFNAYTAGNAEDILAAGTSDTEGKVILKDSGGSEFSITNGDSATIGETQAPEGYLTMIEDLPLSVDENNVIYLNDKAIADGETVEGEYYKATLSEDILQVSIYDREKPPVWKLTGHKYGTRITQALLLAGAEFKLYTESVGEDGTTLETELATAVSSDGKNIGEFSFVDDTGQLMELACGATYILRETKAPLGYDLMEDIRIQVDAEGNITSVTQGGEEYQHLSWDDTEKILSLDVIDSALYTLPKTSGVDMRLYMTYAIGMMSAGAAGYILIKKRRTR